MQIFIYGHKRVCAFFLKDKLFSINTNRQLMREHLTEFVSDFNSVCSTFVVPSFLVCRICNILWKECKMEHAVTHTNLKKYDVFTEYSIRTD